MRQRDPLKLIDVRSPRQSAYSIGAARRRFQRVSDRHR
ncbi:hypothetical protein BSLA_02f3592 [Burkholderia stabilis]|nr:hypothetical protein BSLA_02f3592 [Burkholderia stabilis]